MTRQLAGLNCMFCDQRISGDLDAEFCPGCGGPHHSACRAKETPQGDEPRCDQCGAELSRAHAAGRRITAPPPPPPDPAEPRAAWRVTPKLKDGIPYALDYGITLRGQAVKVVCCEGCARVYGYRFVRTGLGAARNFLFLDHEGARHRAT